MNPFLLLLANSTDTALPTLPQVWVSETHVHNTSANRIEVHWRLSVAEALAETLYVNIYHSSTQNGQRENWEWDIPAGLLYVEAQYNYPLQNLNGVSELEFGITAGTTYAIPDTGVRPAEVRVNVQATTTPQGDPNGPQQPTPDWPTVTFEGPLQVDGTSEDTVYVTGRQIRSANSQIPGVDIIGPLDAVIIDDLDIEHAGYAIRCWYQHTRVYIRNTFARGIEPTETTEYPKERRFFTGDGIKYLEVTNCSMENTAGILIDWGTDPNLVHEGCLIQNNVVKNIDGSVFNGNEIAQFVQMRGNSKSIANLKIRWNQVVNIVDQSYVEDNINLYNVRGTQESPLHIHDNYIEGAFPNPRASNPAYSGGGLICDSADEAVDQNDPIAVAQARRNCTAYVLAEKNMFNNVGQYCMGVAGGNNITYKDNRCVVSGKFRDTGLPWNINSSGIWANDYYQNGATHTIRLENNVSGVSHGDGSRNDYGYNTLEGQYTPDGIAKLILVNNSSLPAGEITLAQVSNEWNTWRSKLASNNIVLGPRVPQID